MEYILKNIYSHMILQVIWYAYALRGKVDLIFLFSSVLK